MTGPDEHLILKYLQGTLSPDERTEFDRWLNLSDENKKMIIDFESVWRAGIVKEKKSDYQTQAEWTKLHAAINQDAEKQVIPLNRPQHINTRLYALKVAAAIAFFLVFSFGLYRLAFRAEEIIHSTTDQIVQVNLPDGSSVWLNKNSRLVYSSDFSDDRNLSLDGEAFFDVKPDPNNPFVIDTHETQVKVLGTSFNVKSYATEALTEVFVVTGKVNFSAPDRASEITLTPGMIGIFNPKDHPMIHLTEGQSNVLAWKNKRLTFSKTPLREVLKTVQNYFKININVKNKMLLNCRFTSDFKDPTLSEVIETLTVALDLQVDHQADAYTLDGEGCNTN
jgi:transmembrane sensor